MRCWARSNAPIRQRLAWRATQVEALRAFVHTAAWRDARVQAIGGGATEVMLEEVAKRRA